MGWGSSKQLVAAINFRLGPSGNMEINDAVLDYWGATNRR